MSYGIKRTKPVEWSGCELFRESLSLLSSMISSIGLWSINSESLSYWNNIMGALMLLYYHSYFQTQNNFYSSAKNKYWMFQFKKHKNSIIFLIVCIFANIIIIVFCPLVSPRTAWRKSTELSPALSFFYQLSSFIRLDLSFQEIFLYIVFPFSSIEIFLA